MGVQTIVHVAAVCKDCAGGAVVPNPRRGTPFKRDNAFRFLVCVAEWLCRDAFRVVHNGLGAQAQRPFAFGAIVLIKAPIWIPRGDLKAHKAGLVPWIHGVVLEMAIQEVFHRAVVMLGHGWWGTSHVGTLLLLHPASHGWVPGCCLLCSGHGETWCGYGEYSLCVNDG